MNTEGRTGWKFSLRSVSNFFFDAGHGEEWAMQVMWSAGRSSKASHRMRRIHPCSFDSPTTHQETPQDQDSRVDVTRSQ